MFPGTAWSLSTWAVCASWSSLSTLVAHVQVQEGPCMTSEPLPHVEGIAAIHLVMVYEHTAYQQHTLLLSR
jgi:hypothetical protein